jgi:UDP-N-acetylmuramoyl-tripeptide--D-alanyl-D-alanine ligase
MFRTTFIAITGSLGKTTAKECLAGILSCRFRTFKSFLNQNDYHGVPRNILRIRPWHRFAVVEIGIAKPGDMAPLARLVRPDVAVMLCVAGTHTTAFRDLDQHAAAKALLLRKLRRGGKLILNGDDPRVAAMADPKVFVVKTFGISPLFDMWADRITGKWPKRLKFRVHSHSESAKVETQLVGTHWLPSVLAALTTARYCGVKLREAVDAIRHVKPFPGRLQPVQLPSGAIVLRDDYNASLGVLNAALRVLDKASAARRLLVISDFSDFKKNRRHRLKYLGKEVARVAEVAVFIGERAAYGIRRAIDSGMRPENGHHFESLEQATQFLRGYLEPNDLMLLKGRTTDHISRVFFGLLGNISCWRKKCSKTILCDFCPELGASPDAMRMAIPINLSFADEIAR